MNIEKVIAIPIIKVVGRFCNLRCKYCFYRKSDQGSPSVMKLWLLEKLIQQHLSLFSGRLKFIWHGGEPLLAGKRFFEHMLSIQKKHRRDGQKIENLIQTNGTLIDDGWASFFKEYDFRVGVSLDGRKEAHDRFRVDRNGNGTFERVVDGLNALKRHGICPGIIQTVSRCNLREIKRDFDFFVRELNLSGWSINVCDGSYSGETGLNDEEVSLLYHECKDFWVNEDNPNLSIREIDNILAGIVRKKPSSCSFNGTCGSYFCVEHDGLVYPCDRLSYHPKYLWGDLKSQPLSEILQGSKANYFWEIVHNLPQKCRSCKWVAGCNNGCSAMVNRDGVYSFCNARRHAFESFHSILSEK